MISKKHSFYLFLCNTVILLCLHRENFFFAQNVYSLVFWGCHKKEQLFLHTVLLFVTGIQFVLCERGKVFGKF